MPVPGFTYDQLPQRVVFGVDAARTAIAPEIERLGARRVLAIASTRDAERVAALLAPLGERVVGTFTEVREHVPLPTAEAARTPRRPRARTCCSPSAAARPSGRPRPSP